MLVEMLREKQEDLVVMHLHRSVWHLPLPSNSGHAACVESGRARMGWEVDAGSCADWSFCLQMQSLGSGQLPPEFHDAEGSRVFGEVSSCFWKRRSWLRHGLALLLQALSA